MDANVLYGKFLYEDNFESSTRKAIWFVEMSTVQNKSLSHNPIPDVNSIRGNFIESLVP